MFFTREANDLSCGQRGVPMLKYWYLPTSVLAVLKEPSRFPTPWMRAFRVRFSVALLIPVFVQYRTVQYVRY